MADHVITPVFGKEVGRHYPRIYLHIHQCVRYGSRQSRATSGIARYVTNAEGIMLCVQLFGRS
jgi:hypothetical protein